MADESEDAQQQCQAEPVALRLLERFGAKHQSTQVNSDDEELVHDGPKKTKKSKHKKKKKKHHRKHEVKEEEPVAPAEVKVNADHEKLILETGSIDFRHTVEVDLKAYRTKLSGLKHSFKKEGKETENVELTSLLRSFDKHKRMPVPQLVKIYHNYGDDVVPETILNYILTQYGAHA